MYLRTHPSMAVGTQGMFVFCPSGDDHDGDDPGMGHVLLRGRQGSLQGCSCSDQARSTSQGIIILIIIFIKINNHHHQKLHLLWLFSKQSNKFTNHPGLLRQYHCIESNCNNSIQLKKVPSLFFYFIKCTRFAGGVLQCTKPLRC